ncbi:MAG TPA: protein kinase, partial [Labilithrix sp.]
MSDEHIPPAPPVRVIEQIPVPATAKLTPQQIANEKIPSPPHLTVGPELARGGMGHVHPATDRNLLRHVAMKRLDPRYATKTFYRDSFIAEAQMSGQLEHPNIVPVHELAVDGNGIPFFTMKLIQGGSFEAWLREHELGSVERVSGGIEILLKIADALAYAHYRGVVHRDLKPANIMVGDFGQVYLMDWGLAKLIKSEPASGPQALMNAPGPVGTPEFMAPEQARGNPKDVDERSDVFGLGALLFEVLCGHGPYGPDRDQRVVLEKAAKGQVASIDRACEPFGIAKRIRAIAERATQPDPANRYPTVQEMQREMRAFIHGGMHLPRKSFAAGEIIMREGEKGECAYMIIAGRCRAYRTVDGREETLSVMEPGEAFGEMALLLYEPRAASVVAMEAVQVLVLDKSTMNEGLGLSGWT